MVNHVLRVSLDGANEFFELPEPRAIAAELRVAAGGPPAEAWWLAALSASRQGSGGSEHTGGGETDGPAAERDTVLQTAVTPRRGSQDSWANFRTASRV
jgi:hypothetical protein